MNRKWLIALALTAATVAIVGVTSSLRGDSGDRSVEACFKCPTTTTTAETTTTVAETTTTTAETTTTVAETTTTVAETTTTAAETTTTTAETTTTTAETTTTAADTTAVPTTTEPDGAEPAETPTAPTPQIPEPSVPLSPPDDGAIPAEASTPAPATPQRLPATGIEAWELLLVALATAGSGFGLRLLTRRG